MLYQGEINLSDSEADSSLIRDFKQLLKAMPDESTTINMIITDLKIVGNGNFKSFRLSSTSAFRHSEDGIEGGLLPHTNISRNNTVEINTVSEVSLQELDTQLNFTWSTQNSDKKTGRLWLQSDFKTKEVTAAMKEKNENLAHHMSKLKTIIDEHAGHVFFTAKKDDRANTITVLGLNAYSFLVNEPLIIYF
jgi:hypothetical protein